MKPIPFDRFLKAVQKALDFHQLRRREIPSASPDYFFVKSNGKYERVAFNDILYIEVDAKLRAHSFAGSEADRAHDH